MEASGKKNECLRKNHVSERKRRGDEPQREAPLSPPSGRREVRNTLHLPPRNSEVNASASGDTTIDHVLMDVSLVTISFVFLKCTDVNGFIHDMNTPPPPHPH